MKKLLLLSALFLNSLIIFSQAPIIQWQKSLGGSNEEEAYSIKQATDGGYIIVGSSSSNDGDVTGHHGGSSANDYWIVKLDSLGNKQWQKSLGGTDDDYATFVQQTTDGGYIIAGVSNSNDGDVTGNHGNYDYWIVKLDNTGTILWQKSFGGSSDDFAAYIQQTSDGGYIIGGISNSNDGDVTTHHNTTATADYWIVKLNSSGVIQWQKSLGGTDDDYATFVQQTTDGGYIVSGSSFSNTNGDVTGNHGNSSSTDYWIVKLDINGIIQWQKSLGGTNSDWANSIQQTTDGGYIITGESISTDGDITNHIGDYDYWVVKLDGNGIIQWQKSLGGIYWDKASSIQQTSDGGYIIAGFSYSNNGDVSGHWGSTFIPDYWIVKINSIGTLQWQKSLGGTDLDMAYSIQQTSDGGYIIAGYSESNDGNVTFNNGLSDYWIVKLSATTTGVEENSIQNLISVYPNPNTGTFIIKTKCASTYSIINELGQTIQQVELNSSNNYSMNIENLSNGIYFIVGYNNNNITRQKVVVTK